MGQHVDYRSTDYEQYGWPALVQGATNLADKAAEAPAPENKGHWGCLVCLLGSKGPVCSGRCDEIAKENEGKMAQGWG